MDFKQRFVFDDADVRGCYVALGDTCEQIQATHHYPAALATLINEFAVAATLLRDSIKVDGSLTIQLRTKAAIDLLMADCFSDGRVRAICEYDQAHIFTQSVVLNELNGAVLAVTITPDEGERYQSVIPVERATLSDCLQDYFERSEQLPSRFHILPRVDSAVGLSLHALPAKLVKEQHQSQRVFEHLSVLLTSLTDHEAHNDTSEQALLKLFHDEQCRVFDRSAIRFGCECSEQKSLQAIEALGEQEAKALIEHHQQGDMSTIIVDCHFCFQRYEFGFEHIRRLFKEVTA